MAMGMEDQWGGLKLQLEGSNNREGEGPLEQLESPRLRATEVSRNLITNLVASGAQPETVVAAVRARDAALRARNDRICLWIPSQLKGKSGPKAL